MARILYMDCFSGASGDMILGALLDLGLPLDLLRQALGSLGVGGYRLDAARVLRSGIAATRFELIESTEGARQAAEHAHDRPAHRPRSEGSTRAEHDAGHHVDHQHDGLESAGHQHGGHEYESHRSLREIHGLIDQAALSAAGRQQAHALFDRLAGVEADIHQIPVDQIHLHEVGALDSIIDIVGIVFGLEWLHVDRVVSSPLNVGGGTVQTAHGLLPVPAPATIRLLAGAPVYSSGGQAELVTPTGALIVTAYARQFGPIPPMTIGQVGYGAGARDLPGGPNVLRLVVGETDQDAASDEIMVVECEIDDMNPQLYGVLIDQLYTAGALEVFYTPVQMKKNRPGTLVTVLVAPGKKDAIAGTLFRETTTIGLRYHTMWRECLAREIVPVETPAGIVRFKVARRAGVVMNASPEFEDCLRLAIERHLSPKEVQAMAIQAYRTQMGSAAAPAQDNES